MNKASRILITRTDRLGDVLLSLPAVAYLRKQLPSSEIHFVCKADYLTVIGGWLEANQIVGHGLITGGVTAWKDWIAAKKFDAALLLYADRPVYFATWAAKVALRAGSFSKPWSLLTLNTGLRQRRSSAEKNEAIYNLQLAQKLLEVAKGKVDFTLPPGVELPRDSESAEQAKDLLKSLGVNSDAPYVVIHPGMGGSALNLSARQYVVLLQSIEKKRGVPVIVTKGPATSDDTLLSEMRKQKKDLRVVENIELKILREVFRRAELVIGPSTGPLHLAHFVGTKTVGIYSPVRSHHASRWQPFGGVGKSAVVYPHVPCPGRAECIGPRCSHFFCMDQLPWHELVLEQMG